MRADLNASLRGLHGALGNLVYRQLDGRTVVSRKPKPQKRKPSKLQTRQRDAMADANEYARGVLADPWRRRVYEELGRQLGRRYDRLPISDFMHPPVVEEIDVSAYHGQPGDVVTVFATDDIEVVSVEVVIRTATGETVESGPARSDHGIWRYAATRAVPAGSAVLVTATAMDRPEHTGKLTVTHVVPAAG